MLRRIAEAFVGGERRRIEWRHHVDAVSDSPSNRAVHARSDVEPCRRNDHGIDERPLDAVKRRRLMALVDDANGDQQHAGAEVQGRRQQDVEVGLFELQFPRFLEPLHHRMFEFEFAYKPQSRIEVVRDEQYEAMEIQHRWPHRIVNRFVEVHLHVAGDRAGPAARLSRRLRERGVAGHTQSYQQERSDGTESATLEAVTLG